MTTIEVLDRTLYSTGEAAQFLQLPRGTLKRWLEGVTVSGRFYLPVIRDEPTGSDDVTWAEFVEAGFLREYRARGVSLQHMRPFVERARNRTGVPYPLAHFRPLIENRRLVYDLQQESNLEAGLYLVRPGRSQDEFQLAPPVEQFLLKVEFAPEGYVNRFMPQGPESPVAIDPERSFGIPQIRGVRTEALAEAVNAGEPVAEVADEWDLDRRDVKAALEWERAIGRLPVAA
jgi:uncharacterized protein (DUF433 family)